MRKIIDICPEGIRYNLKVDLFNFVLFDYKWDCFVFDNENIIVDYLEQIFS